MDAKVQPSEVLLVGSVPLNSAEEVIITALDVLPGRLHRVPDGETGDRSNFIAWQHGTFPIAVVQQRWGGGPLPEMGSIKYSLSDIKPTGYDDRAIASYATFCKLRAAGTIPPGVRFQVSIPAPLSVVRGFVETEYCPIIEPLYEERLLQALRPSLEAERGRVDDPYWKAYFSPVKPGVFERLTRLVKAVDADVTLGYHLCYGDLGHVHFVQPLDTELLVDMANSIMRILDLIHPTSYIHMPVPKDRTDEAYFKPLENLNLGDAKLFLGLVHPNDKEGTEKRIQAAGTAYSKEFGVATECGMGRFPQEELGSILDICASVTKPSPRK
ncbi:hypothetical protein MMC30_002665 [Trapelia coarctata]|nr:hypothetical protein [Trapelia coarctata]